MKHNTTLVLTEPLPAPGMSVLEARPDVRVLILPAPTEAELARALPEADGVVMVMEQPALTARLIELAPRLRIACRFGAGYDNFDVPALTRRGIPLATTGDANADTVAEHAFYLMLALAKRGPALERAVKSGAWPRGFGSVELRGRTCVIVGYGRIGRAVARRAAAFEMKIVAVDPNVPGTEKLADALPQADFVVLACALTPETRGLIGAQALARIKPGAFLVNVARGPIVDEAALVAALEAGGLAGAGLDVLETEPPRPGHPLLARDNVVLTPHVAAFIDTAFERMAVACAQAALAGLDGRLERASVVNPKVLGR
ncbi:MAG: NAD(P)-dependent oxidoreductase [Pseudomonadota bacterium]